MTFNELLSAMKKAGVTLVCRQNKYLLIPEQNVTATIVAGAKEYKAELKKKFFPPLQPKQESLLPELPPEQNVGDTEDYVKEKSSKRESFFLATKEDVAKLTRVVLSGRLRTCRTDLGVGVLEHYFLSGILTSFQRFNDFNVYEKNAAIKVMKLITELGDDKYLNYLDEKYKELAENYKYWAAGYEYSGNVPKAHKWFGDAFSDIHEKFGLEQWVGTAIFLPPLTQKAVTVEEIETKAEHKTHSWLVDENYRIVDPLWLVYPGRIFSYKGNVLF